MTSKICTASFIAVLLALTGCGATVTHRKAIPTSFGEVHLTISSVGGALGSEVYELSFEKRVFFRGGNFSEFKVRELNGKLHLQFCKGYIDDAEPVLIDQGEDIALVRLTLDWSCENEPRKAA